MASEQPTYPSASLNHAPAIQHAMYRSMYYSFPNLSHTTYPSIQTVNAATRMSVNDGGSSGLSAANTESFLAMEMRVKYLESQCEDAQAALARKHARMQEAIDRLSSKQQECDETNGRLEEALNTVAKVECGVEYAYFVLEELTQYYFADYTRRLFS